MVTVVCLFGGWGRHSFEEQYSLLPITGPGEVELQDREGAAQVGQVTHHIPGCYGLRQMGAAILWDGL